MLEPIITSLFTEELNPRYFGLILEVLLFPQQINSVCSFLKNMLELASTAKITERLTEYERIHYEHEL